MGLIKVYTESRFIASVIFVIFIFNLTFAVNATTILEGIHNISCEQAFDLIEKNKSNEDFKIIDFRPENMYLEGHIERAVFYDVFSADIDEWLQSLDKNMTYIIYCTIGHRSGIAFEKMKKMNFINVYHMNSGIDNWKKLGYKAVSNTDNQNTVIPFDSENWQIINGQIIEHLGRQSLVGSAILTNFTFTDGIMEFDISVTGERSYPGIRFRAQSMSNAENIYIRPHVLGRSPDALQYTPIFNREACWQLYNGDGFTSELQIPLNEWVHIKIEVSGTQARVYVNESKIPNLKIDYLKHGISKGDIVLTSAPNGSAHFSNFSIDTTGTLDFEQPLLESTSPGLIVDWKISQPFKYSDIDLEKMPKQQNIDNIEWQKVASEVSGMINISKYIERKGIEPDFVFAKTILNSSKKEKMELKFGYSDWITIFLNGELLFSGSSPYKGRDPSFLGIIGLFDSVTLPLKKGNNELMLIVGESFGGWGFICQDGKAIFKDERLTKLWESENIFTTSESVIYDSKREMLYVTNFDQFNVRNPNAQQFISKVNLNGEIKELVWIDSLNNPLGMTIYKDHLYTAERNSIAEIDLKLGQIVNRYPIAGSIFLNDITIDEMGTIYITDSRKNVIWKYSNGKAEEWLTGEEVSDPNVIYYYDNHILYGNSDDRSLKSVNSITKEVRVIAKFEKGFIDGIRVDNNDNYLVSLWHGIIYQVTPTGVVTEILDTTAPGFFSADFEYIKEKNMLLIPTFFGNTISAYILD